MENIEIQPEPRFIGYSMNTLNIYRRLGQQLSLHCSENGGYSSHLLSRSKDTLGLREVQAPSEEQQTDHLGEFQQSQHLQLLAGHFLLLAELHTTYQQVKHTGICRDRMQDVTDVTVGQLANQ